MYGEEKWEREKEIPVQFRVLGCLFVGIRSIVRVRITQKHNHPLLSLGTRLELFMLFSYHIYRYLVNILVQIRISGCLFVEDRSKQMCHLGVNKH